eukprot:CAMPEP_0198729438 /NCGR_PEP_ID=MMETSP1475-20131203/18210_1 /TAXON_ID= ORGANISM="Unidentified sp., Strain CCMP1999" /NCGR_SAMPLE_ID=MMETSP1475 /ASSEMBLY_ACC=CAM_ASM_001111 /LENGTH=186 /DNA_ID=CAMNT_0044492083 /DNA_START=198 /DNA_END=759 /DNA_ORIENTATION=-
MENFVDQLTAQLAEMEKRLQQAKSERLPLPRSEHLCEDVIGEVYDIAASLEPFLTGDEQKWLHDSLKQVDSEAQELAAMIPGREVENAEQPQQVEGSAGPSVLPDPPLPAHEDVDSCPNSSARDDVEADRDTVCPACKSSLAQAESLHHVRLDAVQNTAVERVVVNSTRNMKQLALASGFSTCEKG